MTTNQAKKELVEILIAKLNPPKVALDVMRKKGMHLKKKTILAKIKYYSN